MPTLYVTAPPEEATELAERLVDERLAACVNRIPCHSTYRWEDEIHHDDEEILLCKTTDEAADRLERRLTELHPYDVPCIERFEEAAILDAFASWRADSVE